MMILNFLFILFNSDNKKTSLFMNKHFDITKTMNLLWNEDLANPVTGLDTRYGENHTDSSEELFYIYKNFHNKKILNRLLEDKINVLEKLQIIEREDIFNETMCINILNGGLLDDFNFEI